MKRVEKKILPEYYREVRLRRKTFEIRKDEDDIQVGDILTLREWSPESGYTGHKLTREVTYVLRNCLSYGLQDGYCVIAIQPIGWDDEYYTAHGLGVSETEYEKSCKNNMVFR